MIFAISGYLTVECAVSSGCESTPANMMISIK